MSVRPILFNTEMVRAILDGRKTVTRRVVKLPDRFKYADLTPIRSKDNSGRAILSAHVRNGAYVVSPYRPGDILYVRETWRLVDFDCIESDWSASVQYKADMAKGDRWHDLSPDDRIGWRPSIHMPREAARIFLRVTDVRVERLREIPDSDCLREGAEKGPFDSAGIYERADFACLWDSTIKPADRERCGWMANPWVWVIEFERCEKPEEG